jgi:hypothetical protein
VFGAIPELLIFHFATQSPIDTVKADIDIQAHERTAEPYKLWIRVRTEYEMPRCNMEGCDGRAIAYAEVARLVIQESVPAERIVRVAVTGIDSSFGFTPNHQPFQQLMVSKEARGKVDPLELISTKQCYSFQ